MVLASLVLEWLALFGVACAVPTTPAPKYYSLNQLARFENDPNIKPIVVLDPINLYLDIFFNGFAGVSAALPTVAGVRPQSPNNDIVYGQRVAATIEQGQPSMTTDYPDSTVDYLDLESFYFGCVTGLENSQAARPAGCAVTAECIGPNGEKIAKQSFPFKVTSGGLTPAIIQDMVPAKPNGFKGCRKVDFYTAFDDITGSATVLDTINYIVYDKKPRS